VAFKVIPAEATLTGGEFTSEAEMLASLNHPHIVRVHDYVEDHSLGLIVMELLAGGTLSDHDLDQPQACAVGLAVAAGLGHAHERGILHRDIKTANVLFDADGTVKLSDFGIARMYTGSGVTGTAHGAGTPMYMAPEQISGGRLTPATDLYALGVVLYQLLAGTPPFDPTMAPQQLWQQHLTNPPPPMQGVPRRIADVVLRTLAKHPADRYPDADSLAAALAAAAGDAYGPAWLAATGLPLHLADHIRRIAAPAPPRSTDAAEESAEESSDGFTDTPTASPPRPPAIPPAPVPGRPRPDTGPGPGRSRTRRRRLHLLGAVGLTAILVSSVLIALRPDAPAHIAGPEELSRQLAAASVTAVASDSTLARRLAVAAYRTAPTPQARQSVLAVLAGGDIPLATLTGHTNWVETVAFSPDGHILATGSDDQTARLWNITDPAHPQPLATLAGHTGSVRAAAFSPDGHTLATGSADATARLWNITDPAHPQPLATLAGHTSIVWAAAFSPDGHSLATASYDQTARLWNITDPAHPQRLATLTGHTGPVRTVAFSPDGHTLATGSGDITARLWNITDPAHPQPLATLTGHTTNVIAAAFSPDGHTLATGSGDLTARLWNITDPAHPRPLATLTGSTGYVYAVAFSPDGHTLATASYDLTARLWTITDPAHPQPLATLTGHTGYLFAAAFSPDGRTLATGSGDRTARLWDLDADRLIAAACADPVNRLTADQWHHVLPHAPYQQPCT